MQVFRRISNREKCLHNVLILCHPLDYDKYLNLIAGDLEPYKDCALYCHSNPYYTPTDMEDYYAQLSSFSLFVFPVTACFLSEGSRTKEIDLDYANSHNIPVLPIMVEPNLYESFDNYSKIQMLDRLADNETQESYEVKLKKYLESSLINDEVISRIKHAFDAYVFLSYRKKDRKYAQEVMSIIRKNNFMRDIAIWYDEYLTPGEDFNEEIADNLLKSKIMALVVTPNINEKHGDKGNYVIEVEYPQATNAGIPVLPIESLNTDLCELKNNFKSIREPIGKENAKAIADSLKELLFSEGMKENNNPEHLFMVGLAYINGIDVERNLAKGLEIIEKSSDLGFTVATEYLANTYKDNMYCFDMDKHEFYLGRAFQQMQKEYESKVEKEMANKLVSILLNCPPFQKDDDKVEYCINLIENKMVDDDISACFLCNLMDKLKQFSRCETILRTDYPELFDDVSPKYYKEAKMVANAYDTEYMFDHFGDSALEDTMHYVTCCKAKQISLASYFESLVDAWNFCNAFYYDDLLEQVEELMKRENGYFMSASTSELITVLSDIRFDYVDDEAPEVYKSLLNDVAKEYRRYETKDPAITGSLIQILNKNHYDEEANSVFREFIESDDSVPSDMIHNLLMLCRKLRCDGTNIFKKIVDNIELNYHDVTENDLLLLEEVLNRAVSYNISDNIRSVCIKLIKNVYEYLYSCDAMKMNNELLRLAIRNNDYKNDVVESLFKQSINGLEQCAGETIAVDYAKREYQKYKG